MTTPLTPIKRLTAIAMGAALSLCGLAVAPANAAPVTIDIATVNDFHGRIQRSGQAAGAAVLACAVDAVRASNPNTVFVSAGDIIGATTFESAVAQDQPTIDVMNMMGLTTSALGNHEFDKGTSDLEGRVIPGADWSYTAANLYRDGQPAYPQYDIVETGGVKVGFIGAVTEELGSLVSPAGIAGLEIRPMLASVNQVAAQLTDGNAANGEADVLIVLVHDGAATPDLASAAGTAYGALINGINPKVSAVLSGHTHQVYAEQVNGVWVMQSAQYGEQLGRVTLTYDAATKTANVVQAWNEDLVNDAGTPVCAGDPAVQEVVDKAVKEADILGAVPIGRVQSDLRRAAQPDGTENRGGESPIGNFVADVQLWAAEAAGAQIAVMNPGGIRTDITYAQSPTGEGDGIVTYKEAAMVQPFANTIMVTDLTGAQLKTLLEQQWQPAGASRPFLKLGVSSTLTYTYNPTAAAGQRITEMRYKGSLVQADSVYRVAANSFLMGGGDNFTALTTGTRPVDTGWVDLDASVEYFKQKFPADGQVGVQPPRSQRAVGINVVTGADKLYKVGDTITIDVSSLSFSRNEPKPSRVLAIAGTTTVGRYAVDNSIVTATDEVGRARVSFKVTAAFVKWYHSRPAGAARGVVIWDDVNGSIMVPIKLRPLS